METMCHPGYHHNGFVATHVYIYISTATLSSSLLPS